jgi:hypothetical protein
MKNEHNILIGKTEGKSPPGRARNGWEVNIIMDLKFVACKIVEWIRLAQNKVR